MKPRVVKKPWGREIWIARSNRYVGKIIHVKKGHRLSKQYHRFKHETIYADSGCWVLEIGSRRRRMRPGDMVVLPPGTVHRFMSPYEDIRILEISTPHLRDVVRLEDDYGRI
jgi:mannose-6-phosphate isomerase-like protein (cupin superfamily)